MRSQHIHRGHAFESVPGEIACESAPQRGSAWLETRDGRLAASQYHSAVARGSSPSIVASLASLPQTHSRRIDHVGQITAPKLVGANDSHTTLGESRRLFAAASEPKELWIIEGASHTDLHHVAGHEYEFPEPSFSNDICAPKLRTNSHAIVT